MVRRPSFGLRYHFFYLSFLPVCDPNFKILNNHVKEKSITWKEEIIMSSYREYKKKALENPEVKAEYDELQPEYDLIQAMIDARVSQNMTQKDLLEATGITQADISRIENGTRNPSLAMLKRIATGLGMQLRLEFVPTPAKHM